MLDEVERPAPPQHSPDLAQCAGDVRDRAQRPGCERVVDAGVLHGQLLAVQPDELDRYEAVRHATGRQLAPYGGRLDGAYPRDRRGVVGDVAPGAEPDLEDLAPEVSGHPGPQPVVRTTAQRQVGQPRDDLVAVETHLASVARCTPTGRGALKRRCPCAGDGRLPP